MLDRLAYDGKFAAVGIDPHRQKEFARANRHSRRVRFLRKAIPVSCALAVVLPTAFVWFNPFKIANLDVSVGRITVQGSKIVMDAPKLTGYKKDNRAYVVNARSAAQDPRKPNIVELNDIIADIEMPNNGWAKMKSTFGIYDSAAEKMDLSKNVNLRTDTGYDVKTAAAMIEMKSGHVVVKTPVNVVMNGGTIDANTMEIVDNGREVTFEGNVVSVFQSRQDTAAKPATAKKP